jgi:hypothetical protein
MVLVKEHPRLYREGQYALDHDFAVVTEKAIAALPDFTRGMTALNELVARASNKTR